jgi:hypothetical protein
MHNHAGRHDLTPPPNTSCVALLSQIEPNLELEGVSHSTAGLKPPQSMVLETITKSKIRPPHHPHDHDVHRRRNTRAAAPNSYATIG